MYDILYNASLVYVIHIFLHSLPSPHLSLQTFCLVASFIVNELAESSASKIEFQWI